MDISKCLTTLSALACLCVIPPANWAADGDQAPSATPPPSTIRPAPSGPQCEYIEHKVYRPAAEYCGFNKVSAPELGEFECGLVSNGVSCTEQCTFIRCHEPSAIN
jgi:hypothetical protein